MSRYLNLIILLPLFFGLSCSHMDRSASSRNPAASAINCTDLFQSIVSKDFKQVRGELNEALVDQLGSSKAKKVSDNLDALLFIDYGDSVEILKRVYAGELSLDSADISKLYASNSRNTSFKNHLKAIDYLWKDEPDFSLDTLKKLHKTMMSGGVDGLAKKDLGRIRSDFIIGNVPEDWPIDAKTFNELKKNPYISTNGLSQNSRTKMYTGEIGYPNADDFTPYVAKKIKGRNPELYKALKAYQDVGAGDEEELTQRMVNELTEDLLEWFVKQKDQIGGIDTPSDFRKFIKIVAEFQRNLISIHPFADGNGRTVREFALYYPLWKEGFPASRLTNPDSDIYSSLKEWGDQIIQGVENSYNLRSKMVARLKEGLPIENTPELFLPRIPQSTKIHFRQQRPAKFIKDKRKVDIDEYQFAEFVNQAIDHNPDLLDDIYTDSDKEIDKLIDEYVAFLKKSKMDFQHEKFGKEHLELSFIDGDFIDTFGNESYRSMDKWNKKMSRWYSDQTVWRGLADQEYETSEDEILNMFRELHYQFVSNNVMGKMTDETTPDDLLKYAVDDFETYNREVFSGDIVKMAMDHHRAEELYDVSYGYSTSESRTVGKAFAMGAMVIADYGSQGEFQHLLKSRILVGMKQAKKDVRLSRLKQLRPKFSYKYPRQKEVMGIGAADPDSIMFVQSLDEHGKVALSYVRNPKNPAQVLVFQGEVSEVKNLRRKPLRVIDL